MIETEAKSFVSFTHHGLTAVMERSVYDAIKDGSLAPDERGPIFLFVRTNRPVAGGREPWVTGDHRLMHQLTAGHKVESVEFGVPFSNGHQHYTTRDQLLYAFRGIGSVAEAIEAFGLVTAHEAREELRQSGALEPVPA